MPDALEDEDAATGSSFDESPATPSHATVDSLARPSPDMSISEPAQTSGDTTDNDKQKVAPALAVMGPLSTTEEYTEMLSHICYTYGVSALKEPSIATHVGNMEQAVRGNNRLAICQSFARIKTILVATAADDIPDFLDEEYETMVSSAIEEFGVELLNSTEGTMFMESMGEAMVAGQRERLSLAYASLKAYMIAYAGRAVKP